MKDFYNNLTEAEESTRRYPLAGTIHFYPFCGPKQELAYRVFITSGFLAPTNFELLPSGDLVRVEENR